ncbi:response regulator [Blastochloris tepida]|jgi:DNA-directed RNA polymerase specialized sigma24 family protein|uniref:Response regulator n=1 Tax=Blastochloris tepida TaxID=2233851 RepID=A0A348G560_9HYPH|nr:response regulator [Blastochloris tepida]BBF94693.1 response regulator [Blastochloris tepida]
MTTAELVAMSLPYLRRYARAVTGDQTGGDAYVAATLEALLANAPQLSKASDTKVELFRIFSKIWNSLSVNHAQEAAAATPGEARLRQLTPLPRQAFLLVSLENFSEEEGARILGVDRSAFRDLLDSAGRELAEDIATDVLIIEDEPLIALDFEALVESLGHRVLGVARTRDEAVKLAAGRRPGLILADIQLADGSSGLDAVNDLLMKAEVPVVFITAYPERFLTGERPEPAFLIAKPFRPNHAAAVISQALFFERNARPRRRAVA